MAASAEYAIVLSESDSLQPEGTVTVKAESLSAAASIVQFMYPSARINYAGSHLMVPLAPRNPELIIWHNRNASGFSIRAEAGSYEASEHLSGAVRDTAAMATYHEARLWVAQRVLSHFQRRFSVSELTQMWYCACDLAINTVLEKEFLMFPPGVDLREVGGFLEAVHPSFSISNLEPETDPLAVANAYSIGACPL